MVAGVVEERTSESERFSMVMLEVPFTVSTEPVAVVSWVMSVVPRLVVADVAVRVPETLKLVPEAATNRTLPRVVVPCTLRKAAVAEARVVVAKVEVPATERVSVSAWLEPEALRKLSWVTEAEAMVVVAREEVLSTASVPATSRVARVEVEVEPRRSWVEVVEAKRIPMVLNTEKVEVAD